MMFDRVGKKNKEMLDSNIQPLDIITQ